VKPPRVSAPGEEIKPLKPRASCVPGGIMWREARGPVRACRPLWTAGRGATDPTMGRCRSRGRQACPARAAHPHPRRGRTWLGRRREHQVRQGTARAAQPASGCGPK
jgi:hypothetical protein